MAEFNYVFRGEWLADAAKRQDRLTPGMFLDALSHTPEPLLDEPDQSALVAFLTRTPCSDRLRTDVHRAEARRLVGLIQRSRADALCPDAMTVLCHYLEHGTKNRRGRPSQSLADQIKLMRDNGWMSIIERSVDEVLKGVCSNGLARDAVERFRGMIIEDPAWKKLPHSDRVLSITQAILRAQGHNPPALGTLRNRILAHRKGYPQFVVNPQTGEAC